MIHVCAHPQLCVGAFTTEYPRPLSDLPAPDWLQALLRLDAKAPLTSDDAVRSSVRSLLRYGGFKPTGRSKPASEYLLKASSDGTLTSINASVDACNAASLHSGLPISVVDLDVVKPPLRVEIASDGMTYIFNASGQVIDVKGLVCLFDAEGPCANAVKDAQRTKTSAASRRTLSIVWGTVELANRTETTTRWYRDVVEGTGGCTQEARLEHVHHEFSK